MYKARQFVIKIDGPEIKNHTVPFKILSNILDGIQNTFYYIAMEITRREVKSRGRVPADIQQACELRRVMEKPGSYEVVAEIPDPLQAEVFHGLDLAQTTLDKYLGMTGWISGLEDAEDVVQLFPQAQHRTRILKSVERYLPREGDNWSLIFEDAGSIKRYGSLNSQVRQKIFDVVRVPQYETMTVTGKLMRIHLDHFKIFILYPPTGKMLECHYNQEAEDFIIENRDGYIQVTGMIEADEDGNPQRIINVNNIQELDLNPVKLSTIRGKGLILEIKRPLMIEPRFEDQEVVLYYDEFNIIAAGQDREEAIKVFEDDFIWLWCEYALADDKSLSPDAIELKKRLHDLVRRAVDDPKEA